MLRYSEIFLNAGTRQRVTIVNALPSTAYVPSDNHYQSDYELIHCSLIDNAAEPIAISDSSDIYYCLTYHDAAIAESFNNSVNVEGDWAAASKANGKLAIRVDLDNTDVSNAVGNATSVNVTSELWYRATGEEWQILGQWAGKLFNTVAPDEDDMSSFSSFSSSSSLSSLSSMSSLSSESFSSESSSVEYSSSSSSSLNDAMYLAADFGETGVNGTYTFDSIFNSVPSYSQGGYTILKATAFQWQIIDAGSVIYYYQNDMGLTPPLNWQESAGASPAGTVTII